MAAFLGPHLMRLVLLPLLVLVVAGCDTTGAAAPGDLELTTDRTTYLVDADIQATARNAGNAPLSLGSCGDRAVLEVQRWTKDEWETALFLNSPCQAIYDMSLVLEAGEQRGEQVSFFAPGEYRLRAEWGTGGSHVGRIAVSDPFVVEEL